MLICDKVTRTHAISSFRAQFDLTGIAPPNASSDMCKIIMDSLDDKMKIDLGLSLESLKYPFTTPKTVMKEISVQSYTK